MTGLTDELVDDLLAGAAQLAVEMVGMPEDQMTAALFDVQQDLRASLSIQLGARVAAIVVRAFGRAVIDSRAQLQVAGFHDYGRTLQ